MAIGPDDDGFNTSAFTEKQLPDGSWIFEPSEGGAVSKVANPLQYFSDPDLIDQNTGIMSPANRAIFEKRNQPKGGDLMSLWGPLALMGGVLGIGLAGAAAGAGGALGAGEGLTGWGAAEAAEGLAGSGALPESYWGMQANAGNPVGSSAYAGETATGAAGGSSTPSWLSSYMQNVGSPQWLAQQGFSTGVSQLLNGGSGGDGAAVGASSPMSNGLTGWGASEAADGASGWTSGGNSNGFNLTPSNYLSAAQLLSGLGGAFAANKAAGQQSDAATMAALLQQQNFERINAQQQPWIQSGVGALKSINEQMPYFNHQFNAGDLNANMAPNWKFALDQGIGATKNAANLQTGVLSGNALKGIADYTLNKSGDLYQQAFNNYSQNQSNIYNRLSNLAGLGGQAAQTNATAGTAAAQAAGNFGTQAGAAQAAGTVGMANNLSGGLTNAASWYALPNILQSLKGAG